MRGAEHRARVGLPAERTSPRAARRFLVETLHEWDLDEPADTACLLTTELVTNAVLHAGTALELVVEADEDTLRVEVIDTADRMPQQRTSRDVVGITGRGLGLVRALAQTWGVSPRESGKAVWFELPLPRSA